jgi:Spy/CpxP family protein refolding chaperone
MRKSRVTALVIAALVSTASFAQAQSSAPNAPAERHGMGGGMMGRGGRDRGLMKGLKLSDAE